MFELQRVRSDEQAAAWFGVRQEVYLGSGLLTPDDVTDGVYRDSFDDYSEHVLAIHERTGQSAGCARLIVGGPERPLQVERQFDLEVAPASVEISGFAVREPYRTGIVAIGLVRSVMEIAREVAATDVYVEVEDWFLAGLQRVGFPLVQIAEPKWLYNAWNLVAHASVPGFFAGVASQLDAGQSDLVTAYFSHPYDGRIHAGHRLPAQRGEVHAEA